MKIAILTLPVNINYGGALQAFALSRVLTEMGHEVEVLANRDYFERRHRGPFVYASRIVRKMLGDKSIHVFNERKRTSRLKRKGAEIQRFAHEHLNIRPIYSFSEISPDDYDAIVVGSDQVWRKIFFPRMWDTPMPAAYLSFAEGWDIRRIAYAASFGTDNINDYTPAEIAECSRLARLFDTISVREKSGVNICRDNLNIGAQQMPDPTLLLERNVYDDLISRANLPENQGDMFCYILKRNDLKEQTVKQLSEERGLKPFFLGYWKQKDSAGAKSQVGAFAPVEAWLKAVRDSKLVVTDSFHATLFSILFGKPFIVICEEGPTRARFRTLLSTFSLEDRILPAAQPDPSEATTRLRSAWTPPVPGGKPLGVEPLGVEPLGVEPLLEAERARGLAFLRTALS